MHVVTELFKLMCLRFFITCYVHNHCNATILLFSSIDVVSLIMVVHVHAALPSRMLRVLITVDLDRDVFAMTKHDVFVMM